MRFILTKGLQLSNVYQFIRDIERKGRVNQRNRRVIGIAAVASFCTAVFLSFVKWLGWSYTSSFSFQASFFDSIGDAIVSFFSMISIFIARMPSGRKYRFGYGKVEFLSAVLQGMLIFGLSSWVITNVISNIGSSKNDMESSAIGIALISFSTVVTLCLVIFQRYVVKRTKNIVIAADSMHYYSDLFSNVCVIISLMTQLSWLDKFFAICVSLYICFCSARILISGLRGLVDRELPDEEREMVIAKITSFAIVKKIKTLRTRGAGEQKFVEANVIFDGNCSLQEACDGIVEISKSVQQMWDDADVVIQPVIGGK